MTNLLWCSIVILVFIIVILMFYIKKSKEKYRILEMYNEQLLEGCREQNKEYIKMENEIPQFKYFATSLRTFKDYKAINILENKKGHWYIVMEMYSDDSLEFWLSGKRHKAISDCPRLFSTIRNTHIWIDDIYAIDENCGNGTLLLACLFEKAQELHIDTIKGELASVDEERFDKLEHFYKKNGFEVHFNSNRTQGTICKKL